MTWQALGIRGVGGVVGLLGVKGAEWAVWVVAVGNSRAADANASEMCAENCSFFFHLGAFYFRCFSCCCRLPVLGIDSCYAIRPQSG